MLTADQLALRTQGITATDVVALCGLSKYRSPLDVFLEKKGRGQGPTSTPARIGNRLEAVICDLYAEEQGPDVVLKEMGTCLHMDLPWALATPDRLVVRGDRDHLLEAKSRSYRTALDFGEPGTDQVPPDVLAQVHWQMFVTGLARCDVALLVDAHDFRVYQVPADAEAADLLRETAERFWFDHVQADVPPALDGSDSAHRYLAERFRSHTDELVLATAEQEQLIAELRMVREQIKLNESVESTIQALLKEAIGTNAGLVSQAGHKVTWKATRDSAVIDWKGIVEEVGAGAEIIARHTSTKPGVRRFLPQFNNGAK